jgi:predicted phage gp36 major capsid-like protein
MASNLKRLQDRAAAIASRMSELASIEERSEDQTNEIGRLSTEADKVKADLEFEERLSAKEAELRAVVEKAAPAPEPVVAPVEKKSLEIRQVLPHHTTLRCFNDGPESVEQAYRVGRWIRGNVFRNEDDLRWCRDHGVEARAMNEGSNAAGGALVPEEFSSQVIRRVEEFGTFPASGVETMSMTRDTMVIPKRLAGTTAYFIGEGSAITESEPTYGNVNLVAKKLAVSCRMSSEVVEDALVNLADQVTMEFATSWPTRSTCAAGLPLAPPARVESAASSTRSTTVTTPPASIRPPAATPASRPSTSRTSLVPSASCRSTLAKVLGFLCLRRVMPPRSSVSSMPLVARPPKTWATVWQTASLATRSSLCM